MNIFNLPIHYESISIKMCVVLTLSFKKNLHLDSRLQLLFHNGGVESKSML